MLFLFIEGLILINSTVKRFCSTLMGDFLPCFTLPKPCWNDGTGDGMEAKFLAVVSDIAKHTRCREVEWKKANRSGLPNKRHHSSEVACWSVIKNLVVSIAPFGFRYLEFEWIQRKRGPSGSGRKAFFFRQTPPNLLLFVPNGLGTEKCYPVYDASFSHYRRFMD